MATSSLTSFLIVNYNGGNMLRTCIDSIKRQTCQNFEVIVIDNGSEDGSDNLSEFSDSDIFKLIRLGHNSGFSEANNIAFQQSSGEFIALVNNDVELDENWLSEMLSAAEADNVGSVACQLLQTNKPELLDSAGFEMFFNGSAHTWIGETADSFNHLDHKPFGAVAAAALYKRSAIETLGDLFHSKYFAYYEDNDLALRLRMFGYRTAYAAKAIGWHVGSATGKQQSDFHTYHLRRNIEFLFWVNMPTVRLLLYFPFHILYEFMAFVQLIGRSQVHCFLKAKGSFLSNVAWVWKQRRILRRRLAGAGGSVLNLVAPVRSIGRKFKK